MWEPLSSLFLGVIILNPKFINLSLKISVKKLNKSKKQKGGGKKKNIRNGKPRKSIKSKKEIQNIKKIHIYDGVALTKYLFWVKKNYI